MIQIYNLEKLKEKALENKVPILCDDGLRFLKELIKDNKPKSLLEIGTAIGYSAIAVSLSAPNLEITTIERDELLYQEAIKNIEKFNLSNKIHVINQDALELELTAKFDMIFIDAAKAQYIKFFEKYKSLLNTDGIIVTDNLNFHNLDFLTASKNVKRLITKLNEFKEYVINVEGFETVIYDVGDGMSVSRKV